MNLKLNRRRFITMLLSSAAANVLSPISSVTNAYATATVKDTVIIGGGISGLTSAFHLQDKNIVLLEAEEYFGGRTVSGEHNGWSYTKGTEYLSKPYGTFKRMLTELNLKAVEIPSPMDQIWHEGKLYSGDNGRLQLLAEKGGLTELNKFLSILANITNSYAEVPDFDQESRIAYLDRLTCKEWFDQLQLPNIYSEIYNVTFRGLFGANINEVSAMGAFPEIAFDFIGLDYPVTKEFLQKNKDERNESSGAYSFPNGITDVINALVGRLGDKIMASAKVTGVKKTADGLYNVEYTSNGDTQTIKTRSVIFATPMPVTQRIGSQVLTQYQQHLIDQVPYGPYVTAALFSDEPIFTDAFDLALPDGLLPTDVYDSTWIQRKLGESHKGYIASLYIAPFSYKDNYLLEATDDELLKRSYTELAEIWPDLKQKVRGYDIHRFTYAYPVSTVGAYSRLTKLYGTLNGGVQLAGDGMIYPVFETAIEAGVIAAKRVRNYLHT